MCCRFWFLIFTWFVNYIVTVAISELTRNPIIAASQKKSKNIMRGKNEKSSSNSNHNQFHTDLCPRESKQLKRVQESIKLSKYDKG